MNASHQTFIFHILPLPMELFPTHFNYKIVHSKMHYFFDEQFVVHLKYIIHS